MSKRGEVYTGYVAGRLETQLHRDGSASKRTVTVAQRGNVRVEI